MVECSWSWDQWLLLATATVGSTYFTFNGAHSGTEHRSPYPSSWAPILPTSNDYDVTGRPGSRSSRNGPLQASECGFPLTWKILAFLWFPGRISFVFWGQPAVARVTHSSYPVKTLWDAGLHLSWAHVFCHIWPLYHLLQIPCIMRPLTRRGTIHVHSY